MSGNSKPYTLGTFLLDLILGSCTCGVWWLYRIFRIITTR